MDRIRLKCQDSLLSAVLFDYVIQIRNCWNRSALCIHLFCTAILRALLGVFLFFCFFVCFLFFVCMMLSWSIPSTECSSSEIDKVAQSLLLIFKQRSHITLPLDTQIRLSGIIMISVILYWNRGKKVLTASHALLRHTHIVSMWGDSGLVNLPFTELSFTNWSSV